MKSQPAVPVRTICLGIAAVVFAALAIFMFVSPNAPRLVANTTAAEPETLLTLYEGPKTMKTSQNAAIKVIITSGPVRKPRPATSAPLMPALFWPMKVLTFRAITPGVHWPMEK